MVDRQRGCDSLTLYGKVAHMLIFDEWTSIKGLSPLGSRRKHHLQQAMLRAGIGKAWRKKVSHMASEDLTRFEQKMREKAAANGRQWAEALHYYTAMQVAAALEGKR